ncbi:DUF4917 family protein [Candidatus Synechococcus spongiarum]|uniref:DUF4917 family protein n=1 Tax=Candidatus Synechococcus spongiarum TaxID=431041 RepID=UPI000B2192AB|nr:DUF4917 family protein [Candidatus Synechococcus spongiarum]
MPNENNDWTQQRPDQKWESKREGASRVLTFEEAIQDSIHLQKHRHLLLGNGFSIACRPKIFAYHSLFEQTDFSQTPRLEKAFNAVSSTDFEHVIKMLKDTSCLVHIYFNNQIDVEEVKSQMIEDSNKLKNILINTIANNHPRIPSEIEDEQFWSCRRFLAKFLNKDDSNRGNVYTLNYDLLLYWALMHEDMGNNPPVDLKINDGFGRGENTEPEYVEWMGESNAPHYQQVHYLHGAIHLFDSGTEIKKYTWRNTDKSLLDQAHEAMNSGKFPLFVAEGESKLKLEKI